MESNNPKGAWEEYREKELRESKAVLEELGYTLDEHQVHIGGERFLMMDTHDVGGGGYKLVLTGERMSDRTRAIIKISSIDGGKKEIDRERKARRELNTLRFAYQSFFAPEELLYTTKGGLRIFITEFIAQEKNFLERPLEEQFTLALKALKIQEGAHATTFAHTEAIQETFGLFDARKYLLTFKGFADGTKYAHLHNSALTDTLQKAEAFLTANTKTLEQYCGFLTHADFVPHNLRIRDTDLYLLDFASIHFGNKHESWARFLNFMTLYNPPLERALREYITKNRTPEESLSLELMRVYKLGFLLFFYAKNLNNTEGALKELTNLRLKFWREALEAVLLHTELLPEKIARYKAQRDELRNEDELIRQKQLH